MSGGTAVQSVSDEAGSRAITIGRTSDRHTVVRIDTLTTEVGWMLVTAGVIGVIAPGIPGMPFLIIGVLVITPGGKNWLSRRIGNNPPRFIGRAMKPMARFLDDLERRYPRGADHSS